MQIRGVAAIVTGGGSGLGEATARMLAESGAYVSIFDVGVEQGERVAAGIGGLFCRADVTEEASVDAALCKAREAQGVERVLVNCAGIGFSQRLVRRDSGGKLAHHDLAAFRRTLDVNLFGAFHMMAKSALAMSQSESCTDDGGRGVIINTASIAAVEGQIGQAAYSASKGGVVGMTLPVARDLARSGIRVMTILPGSFHTPMFAALPDDARRQIESNVPFPSRLGRPSEFAQMVRAIVENDMLNGESIRLDGALRLTPK